MLIIERQGDVSNKVIAESRADRPGIVASRSTDIIGMNIAAAAARRPALRYRVIRRRKGLSHLGGRAQRRARRCRQGADAKGLIDRQIERELRQRIIISPRAIDGAARGPDRRATIGFRLPAAEYFAADQPDLVGADAGDSPVAGGAQARRRLIPPVVAAFEITIEG